MRPPIHVWGAGTLPLPVVHLAPGDSRTLRVNLKPALSFLGGLRFAGKITLALEVIDRPGHALFPRGHRHFEPDRSLRLHGCPPGWHQRPSTDVSLPTLYFHPERYRLVIYREDAMRERSDAGDFRRDEPDG